MYRTHYMLVLLSLHAGMAHSFSWEIVTTVIHSNRLDFYDSNGTLTHTENITFPLNYIRNNIIYDPVHDRVIFADTHNIYSFDIATRKAECFIRNTNRHITSLAYDPASELLFWVEFYTNLYSISLKPGLNNTNYNEKQLISLDELEILEITVDSCGGFIYYVYSSELFAKHFGRARFDGSEREVVVDHVPSHIFFDTVQQSHKSFWFDDVNTGLDDTILNRNSRETTLKYADLNGQNMRTVRQLAPKSFFYSLTASKEFIYIQTDDFTDFEFVNSSIWKIPKNPPSEIDMESKLIVGYDKRILGMAIKYNIEDIIQGNQNCDTLKSLLPNNLVSADGSLLCVHGTKVSGESRCECTQGYSGERCDGSVCHNYCLHGDCSASAEGQPKCRCNAGYSGERCEVNECQGYCLNDGVCSLSEESELVCQCTGAHEGDRCEVPVFLMKCAQTVSMLRDILNTDITSVKGVQSSCSRASTPSAVV